MKNSNIKGTTLVEVLATIIILAVVLAPISMLFLVGYRNYFLENEKMIANQNVIEVMENITRDLRENENRYITVDNISNHVLEIKPIGDFPPGEELIYEYIPAQQILNRNGVSIFKDSKIRVTHFYVSEFTDENYDTSLIDISITIEYGQEGSATLRTYYRRKLN